MPTASVQPTSEADPRRRELVEAAFTVFTRYGFRKTSMEEVARAAHVSRQALYLHFASKEALFRATLRTTLEDSLQAATGVLRDPTLAIETKLVRALDGWTGRYVGMLGAGASDLVVAAEALLGSLVKDHDHLFANLITRAIAASPLPAAYKSVGLTARQLAETLLATARGLKHSSASRPAFVRGVGIAVRVLCAPLGRPPTKTG